MGITTLGKAQVSPVSLDSVGVDTSALRIVEANQTTAADSAENAKEQFTTIPWQFHAPLGSYTAATDSSMRWQNWPDWTYKLSRDPGVISNRMGTGLRSNAVERFAHGPRYQQLYWEGISMNDPVSGSVDWRLIPIHQMGNFYNQDLGTQYRSTYYLRQYYLRKPLSRLIYSESKFSHRNLGFEVSHNLSRRTNIQLSYWDRRTGGEYPNSDIKGRQIYGKVSHHLSDRRYIKLNFINNGYDTGRPFGYNLSDLQTFPFDRFAASANEPDAKSKTTSNLVALNFYQRKADSTVATDDLHGGLFYRSRRRSLFASTDSSKYKVKSLGINGKKWFTLGLLSMEAQASYLHNFVQDVNYNSLTKDSWSLFNAEGRATFDATSFIDITGEANFKLRDDGYEAYRLNVKPTITLGPLKVEPGFSAGTVMPTPQQLYWNSPSYQGSESLNKQEIKEAHIKATYQAGANVELGVRAQHKDIGSGIMTVDSTFTNIPNYASQSATAFASWEPTHFEFSGSATVHRFADNVLEPAKTIPLDPAKKVWIKGGAYWKGYLFNHATYIKAGASGMIAPFRYQAGHYQPRLDIWKPVSSDQRLPTFTNVDVDVSARVRKIIFFLSWENVFDDVSQLGYFETAGYPMSQRRFIFGIRALFRN